MVDFAAARRMMVDGQVRTADVTDTLLLAAMLELPRERFFPPEKAALAYLDTDVTVSEPGHPVRRLLKPMVLAKLIQAAEIRETHRVLDVGCATGYSTALLSRLAAFVVGLEQDDTFAAQVSEALRASKITNAKIVGGRLVDGWAVDGPYDAILLQGSTEVEPTSLLGQLKVGGRLTCVLGRAPGKAMIYRRIEGELSGRPLFDAAAPALPGFVRPAEFVF
jgi:protein-L-isoaspartate(D-aspartate) O-methyltransferase